MYRGHRATALPIYDFCPEVSQNPSIIVDLGAHRGCGYEKLRGFYPHSLIHLVEPVPDCIDCLSRATAGDSRAFIHPYAVGKSNNVMPINLFPHDGRQSSNFYSDRMGTYGEPEQVLVPIKHHSVLPDKIDLAKINIEAGEFDLIESGFFDRVDSFVMEAHNNLLPGKTWRDVVDELQDKFELTTAGNRDYKYCFVLGVKISSASG
jgi:FkbM family methyltransferase